MSRNYTTSLSHLESKRCLDLPVYLTPPKSPTNRKTCAKQLPQLQKNNGRPPRAVEEAFHKTHLAVLVLRSTDLGKQLKVRPFFGTSRIPNENVQVEFNVFMKEIDEFTFDCFCLFFGFLLMFLFFVFFGGVTSTKKKWICTRRA